MVQREVALRIAADPPDMSILGVAVQLYATARLLFDVPPEAFVPKPKVFSSVVLLDRHPEPLIERAGASGILPTGQCRVRAKTQDRAELTFCFAAGRPGTGETGPAARGDRSYASCRNHFGRGMDRAAACLRSVHDRRDSDPRKDQSWAGGHPQARRRFSRHRDRFSDDQRIRSIANHSPRIANRFEQSTVSSKSKQIWSLARSRFPGALKLTERLWKCRSRETNSCRGRIGGSKLRRGRNAPWARYTRGCFVPRAAGAGAGAWQRCAVPASGRRRTRATAGASCWNPFPGLLRVGWCWRRLRPSSTKKPRASLALSALAIFRMGPVSSAWQLRCVRAFCRRMATWRTRSSVRLVRCCPRSQRSGRPFGARVLPLSRSLARVQRITPVVPELRDAVRIAWELAADRSLPRRVLIARPTTTGPLIRREKTAESTEAL